MTAAPGPAGRPRRRRWLGAALVASLAINLFLVGLLAGGWLAQRPDAAFNPAAGPGFMPHMIRSLPPQAREAAIERFAERRGALRSQMLELRQARRAVYQALTAEEFDRGTLEVALTDLRRQAFDLQAGLHAGIVAVAGELADEDRQAMAETLRGLARGHGHMGRGMGPGMGPGRTENPP